MHDIEMLTVYMQDNSILVNPSEVETKHLQHFIKWIAELGMSDTSQARIISGIRSFYKYCLIEQISKKDPTLLLEAPKLKRKLPDVLSFEEIENIISQIDLSKPEGGQTKPFWKPYIAAD